MSKARQLADNGAATPNRNMVISGENAAVQAIANAAWTDAVNAAYKAAQEAS